MADKNTYAGVFKSTIKVSCRIYRDCSSHIKKADYRSLYTCCIDVSVKSVICENILEYATMYTVASCSYQAGILYL